MLCCVCDKQLARPGSAFCSKKCDAIARDIMEARTEAVQVTPVHKELVDRFRCYHLMTGNTEALRLMGMARPDK